MTAGSRACWNCRRPAGCAAIACARSAACGRRRSTGCASGVTIDGIRYGPIEATLDREQGANVWLTFGIREGKNREVRKVLESLGLKVNRLIRVAFGPFDLGDLDDGAVRGNRDVGAARKARRADRRRLPAPISTAPLPERGTASSRCADAHSRTKAERPRSAPRAPQRKDRQSRQRQEETAATAATVRGGPRPKHPRPR